MNTTEFDKHFAAKTGVTIIQAGIYRKAFLDTVKDGIIADGKTLIRNELKFDVIEYKPTIKRMPNKKLIHVPGGKKIRCSCLKNFENFIDIL